MTGLWTPMRRGRPAFGPSTPTSHPALSRYAIALALGRIDMSRAVAEAAATRPERARRLILTPQAAADYNAWIHAD